MYDILIIGGGPGGMYASIIASLYNLKSCIIETSSILGGQPIFLYPIKDIFDFPCFKSISGKKIIEMLSEQMDVYVNNRIDVFLETKVEKINKNKSGFKVFLNNEKTLKTKSIILASGFGSFEPKKILINEKEVLHDNLHYFFKSESFYKNKNIVILGGGDSALDWAIHLKSKLIAKNVTLIHRTNNLRAREDKIQNLSLYNILVFLDKKILSINKKKIIFQSNKNQKKQSIYFDEILVQYGFETIKNQILDFFPKIKIEDKSLVVNNKCQSSIEMVYAIGQVSKYDSKPNLIIVSMSEAAKAVNDIFFKFKKEA